VLSVGVEVREGETGDEEADVVDSIEEGDEPGGEYAEEVDRGGSNGVVSATVLEDVVVEA